MRRHAAAFLALLALAIPAGAANYVHLWQIEGSRVVDGTCQAVSAEENFNRASNLARMFDAWRAPLEVTADGSFDPSSGNIILGCGATYESSFALAEATGTPVILDYIQEATGDEDGDGYHSSRPPRLNPGVNKAFALNVLEWLSVAHPGVEIVGWQAGNESQFDRTGTYSHAKWRDAFLALKSVHPASWSRFSGGNSGHEFESGELTLNGYLASSGLAQQHNIGLDVHCNGLTISECREELEELPDRYPGVWTAQLEDRPPYSVGHNDAKDRAKGCARSGARWCAIFGIRDSGTPPLPSDVCRWGVNNPKPDRWDIGLIGCNREKRKGQDGTPRNIAKAISASKYLGSFKGGDSPLLPWDVGGSGPPPPPPPPPATPPGLHQLCAIFTIWHRDILCDANPGECINAVIPTPEPCKLDEGIVAAWCNLLARTGSPELCAAN